MNFLPKDKSIAQRCAVLGLDFNQDYIGEDVKSTIEAVKQFNENLDPTTLDLGNSGTGIRLLSGYIAGSGKDCTLIGDKSLSQRPMNRIAEPLNSWGAEVSLKEQKFPPIEIKGTKLLSEFTYNLTIPSAQIKSCLVLASLFLDGTSIIKETIKTRDHTERMLQFLDYPISIDDKIISINGKGTIVAKDIRIPSDISSASFLIVGALIAPNSNIILKSIGINPFRTGIIDVLIKMGADIKMINHTNIGNEPVADIIVRSSILNPVNLSGDIISRLIDELPI